MRAQWTAFSEHGCGKWAVPLSILSEKSLHTDLEPLKKPTVGNPLNQINHNNSVILFRFTSARNTRNARIHQIDIVDMCTLVALSVHWRVHFVNIFFVCAEAICTHL